MTILHYLLLCATSTSSCKMEVVISHDRLHATDWLFDSKTWHSVLPSHTDTLFPKGIMSKTYINPVTQQARQKKVFSYLIQIAYSGTAQIKFDIFTAGIPKPNLVHVQCRNDYAIDSYTPQISVNYCQRCSLACIFCVIKILWPLKRWSFKKYLEQWEMRKY